MRCGSFCAFLPLNLTLSPIEQTGHLGNRCPGHSKQQLPLIFPRRSLMIGPLAGEKEPRLAGRAARLSSSLGPVARFLSRFQKSHFGVEIWPWFITANVHVCSSFVPQVNPS